MTTPVFYINGTTAVLNNETWSAGKFTIFDILTNLIVFPFDITHSLTNITSASQLYMSLVFSGNYWAIAYGLLTIYLFHSIASLLLVGSGSPHGRRQPSHATKKEEDEEPIVLRDFTPDQLRAFNGENGKPIYIALKREVFDVSKAPEYYGKGAG